jgi:hypothetical protein
MQFSAVEVVKTKNNTFFLEWDVSVAPGGVESVDDYLFEIYWSYDPVSDFLPIKGVDGNNVRIDGAIGPLSYDHSFPQYDFNKDRFYKILSIKKANQNDKFFSKIVFIGNIHDGVSDSIRHAESVLYDFYVGEPCHVIKKKSSGTRCTRCWSESRQQRLYGQCDVCKGSGFISGYYQPIDVQISFDSDPVKSDVQRTFENVKDTVKARLSNYPTLRPKDIIINKDDYKRYVVSHVDTTKLPSLSQSKVKLSRSNYIISQILILEELDPTDNEYNINL